MGLINKVKTVPYQAWQMYALVNDIKAYPAFIPWCRDAVLHEQEEKRLRASVVLGVGKLNYKLTTENRMRPDERIEFSLVEGPFRRLEGYWSFDVSGSGSCRVGLYLEFEFKNPMLKLALGKFYEQINNSMIDVFNRRAMEIYGAPSA